MYVTVSHVFVARSTFIPTATTIQKCSGHRVRQSKDLLDLLKTILQSERKLQQYPSLLRVIEPTPDSEALITARHESISAPVARHHRNTSSIEQSVRLSQLCTIWG